MTARPTECRQASLALAARPSPAQDERRYRGKEIALGLRVGADGPAPQTRFRRRGPVTVDIRRECLRLRQGCARRIPDRAAPDTEGEMARSRPRLPQLSRPSRPTRGRPATDAGSQLRRARRPRRAARRTAGSSRRTDFVRRARRPRPRAACTRLALEVSAQTVQREWHPLRRQHLKMRKLRHAKRRERVDQPSDERGARAAGEFPDEAETCPARTARTSRETAGYNERMMFPVSA